MTNTNVTETKWRSISELALTFGVSAQTVRTWIHRGLLPAAKVGRSLRVRDEDVAAFLQWVVVPDEHILIVGPDDPAPDPERWIRVDAPGCDCGETCRRGLPTSTPKD